MAQLVAHDGEVAAAGRRGGGEADDLVEGHGPVGHRAAHSAVHGVVDRRPHHLEEEGLAADERLVVALDVADGALLHPPVGQLVPDVADVPVFVADIADEVEPAVGDAHRHPVVETGAKILDRRGKTRHAADVLGHGEDVWPKGVDEAVGEVAVDPGVLVDLVAKVHGVVGEHHPKPVVKVEH